MAKLQTTHVFKAQWPMSSNESVPMILIYEADSRRNWSYLPATPQVKKHLFKNKFVRVYFRGRIENGKVEVDEFVRKDEWC